MPKISIKPLSVNQAWKGRRFKTSLYKQYERDLLLLLPRLDIPPGKLKLSLVIGFSNSAADIDNIAKPFIDILQKKYKFNDREIYVLYMVKKIVKKGAEYICFDIEKWSEGQWEISNEGFIVVHHGNETTLHVKDGLNT